MPETEKSFLDVCYVHWHIVDMERDSRDSHEIENERVIKVCNINDEHNARAQGEVSERIWLTNEQNTWWDMKRKNSELTRERVFWLMYFLNWFCSLNENYWSYVIVFLFFYGRPVLLYYYYNFHKHKTRLCFFLFPQLLVMRWFQEWQLLSISVFWKSFTHKMKCDKTTLVQLFICISKLHFF